MRNPARRKAVYLMMGSLLMAVGTVGLTEAARSVHDTGPAQDERGHSERVFRRTEWPNAVVEVTNIKVKNGSVVFNQRFDADDDLLRGLALTVKNISDEPVVFIDVSITLFRKEDKLPNKVPAQISFSYGSDPDDGAPGPLDQAQVINPGESAEVLLTEASYARLLNMLLQHNYHLKFKRVEVSIDRVMFAGGKMWAAGYYFTRDPNNPGRWVRDKSIRKDNRIGQTRKFDGRLDERMKGGGFLRASAGCGGGSGPPPPSQP